MSPVEVSSPDVAQPITSTVGFIASAPPNSPVDEQHDFDSPRSANALYRARLLFSMGLNALKDNNYVDAADCFSRALEISVTHYGELALECASTYYHYGRALYYKALDESEPFPEDDGEGSELVPPVLGSYVWEPLAKRPGSDTKGEGPSETEAKECQAPDTVARREQRSDDKSLPLKIPEAPACDKINGKVGGDVEEQENGYDGDGDSEEEIEEEESDLDLAWKMLDIARVIYERQQSGSVLQTVEVITALGDVSLERGDIEASFNDYSKALAILEANFDSDSRYIAELCYKTCLALQSLDKPSMALNYSQRAVSTCESRLQTLKNQVKTLDSKSVDGHDSTDVEPPSTTCKEDTLAEMGRVAQLLIDYKEKVEELQQTVSNPLFIETRDSIAEINSSTEAAVMSNGFDNSPTNTTATSMPNNSVIDLGVIGRGVKRISVSDIGGRTVKRTAADLNDDAVATPAKRKCSHFGLQTNTSDKLEPSVATSLQSSASAPEGMNNLLDK